VHFWKEGLGGKEVGVRERSGEWWNLRLRGWRSLERKERKYYYNRECR
jgi:hypothetical protein